MRAKQAWSSKSETFERGAHKIQEMKLRPLVAFRPSRSISPLAKLDCFCTQKTFNAFTFSQAQTSLRGGPILEFHLLKLPNSTVRIIFKSRCCRDYRDPVCRSLFRTWSRSPESPPERKCIEKNPHSRKTGSSAARWSMKSTRT